MGNVFYCEDTDSEPIQDIGSTSKVTIDLAR